MNKNIRNYRIGQELGRGAFGVTYYGVDVNNRPVAIKTIDINKSKQLGADLSAINEEIKILREISASNCSKYIACFYESFQDVFNGVPTVFIISEYVNGTSLTDFVANYTNEFNSYISPQVLWPLYLQLIIGLKFIHKKGYAHRDIKPDNILITEDYTIKYIDFGLACLQRCNLSTCVNTCRGTPGTMLYMPPEYFTGNRSNTLESAKAHDIWSLGVVMFGLAQAGNYPFQLFDNNNHVLSNNQIMANISVAPQFTSDYVLDNDGRTNNFINSVLINDWRSRPDIFAVKRTLVNNVLAKVSN